jgi:signal transduction histidine kinase
MSHDLRTPLTAIVGYSEAINARLFGAIGDPRYEEYAKIIQDSGRFLVSLVDDILDLSRIEAERYDLLEETIDIQNIIEDTTNMVRHKAMDKKIEITSSHPHDLPHFIGDKKAITQIFNNILSNALKFTQDGGKVSIETLFQEQRGLIIQFADNGIGMSCQELAAVMEPFERGNSQIARKSEGTGLGLFLSKRLTVLHGGEMLIRSKPAQGTTVTITFPSERAIVAGD